MLFFLLSRTDMLSVAHLAHRAAILRGIGRCWYHLAKASVRLADSLSIFASPVRLSNLFCFSCCSYRSYVKACMYLENEDCCHQLLFAAAANKGSRH